MLGEQKNTVINVEDMDTIDGDDGTASEMMACHDYR